MKPILPITFPVVLALLHAVLPAASAADAEGLAVAIVYDTSGSMNDAVNDEAGKPAPKYQIANRALTAIAGRIQAFATNAPPEAPRRIEAGLFVFQKNGPRAAIPLRPYDATAFTTWAHDFATPTGGTPLGNTLNEAAHAVLSSGLMRKHVLVITDGMNTFGPDPATVLPGLQKEATQKGTAVAVHFVAFDVDAKVFEGVKKLGATVVGAANEAQLNAQLEFILANKILLEDEEPPQKR